MFYGKGFSDLIYSYISTTNTLLQILYRIVNLPKTNVKVIKNVICNLIQYTFKYKYLLKGPFSKFLNLTYKASRQKDNFCFNTEKKGYIAESFLISADNAIFTELNIQFSLIKLFVKHIDKRARFVTKCRQNASVFH